MKGVIVGTAGHIDHGKTTLVKALTGIDADRLDEEKRRGITIDIGFAHFDLDGTHVGFVDVPGHERFVKNMLAGIGGIQMVLLVVAADESVMPQTVEHFQICRLLRIPRGIIVLTKKNRVDDELVQLVEAEVEDLVAGSFLEGAPVVAVDSISREGIDQLKVALKKVIDQAATDDEPEGRHFRLPVDRVFTIRGFGTVVTGTPYSGRVGVEDVVQAYPGQGRSKVRGVQVYGENAAAAATGQRTALNLSGLEKQDLERGTVLGTPGVFRPSSMFDAEISLLKDAAGPLGNRGPIRFHHGAGEFLGRVYLLDRHELRPGETALVQLRLESPTVCCCLDRFILRRYSPMTTIGGGVILDNSPSKYRPKERSRVVEGLTRLTDLLRSSNRDPLPVFVEYYVDCAAAEGLDLAALSARTGLTARPLRELLERLDPIAIVPQDPPLAVTKNHLEDLRRRLLRFLDEFHRQRPLAAGVSREEVKRRFLTKASPAYFQYLLDSLTSRAKVRLVSGRSGWWGARSAWMRIKSRSSRPSKELWSRAAGTLLLLRN